MTTGRNSLGFNRWMKRATGACALAFTLAALGAASAAAAYEPPAGDPKQGEEEIKTDQVELVFKNGNTVKGTLISEDDASIKVRVAVAGISAETSYAKTDILSINRNLPAPAPADGDKKQTTEKKVGASDEKPTSPSTEIDPSQPSVYILTLKGEFGRDISKTPMKAIIQDVKLHQPDYLIIKFEQDFAHWGEEAPDFAPDGGQYDLLENAREISTFLTEGVQRDPEFTKKPKIIGWVKKALGGAAFLPFVCPTLYYHSEGRHGGIGYLDHLFDGVGDERAREKQYSLRLARAKGMAEMGGHDPKIMQAMSRTDYVLSYKLDGGEVVFVESMPTGPSEFLLTDDGVGPNGDTLQDIVRFKANDVLTLDAPTAERIGLSKGTVDNLDELLLAEGIYGEYRQVEGRAKDILEDWSKSVSKAEKDLARMFRQYGQIEVKEPGGYKERTEARGQRKRLLLAMKSTYERYGEAINPRLVGDKDNQLAGIDRAIYIIEQEQRLDRP